MLSVKQEGIKYHFVNVSYDPTGDWAPVSHSIGEHANHYAKGPVNPIAQEINALIDFSVVLSI